MEDVWASFLPFFKKSWAGGFSFSKYSICFSIQTFQNSAPSMTFIVTSSSPKSLLLVQQDIDREQHIDREQLSLCAFPVLKLSKSAVKNAAPAQTDGSIEVTPTYPPVSSPSPHLPPVQISWLTPNYLTKNPFFSCWIREAGSPWSCTIPRKRTGTHMRVGPWRKKGCHVSWQPTFIQD